MPSPYTYDTENGRLDDVLTKLLSRQRFGTQTAIAKALDAAGHRVKQSTVSRALVRLGAVKTAGSNGKPHYRIMPQELLPRQLIREFCETETLLIVKTSPGAANHVAHLIDQQNIRGISGTLAGDNVIFIAPQKLSDIKAILRELETRFQ